MLRPEAVAWPVQCIAYNEFLWLTHRAERGPRPTALPEAGPCPLSVRSGVAARLRVQQAQFLHLGDELGAVDGLDEVGVAFHAES